MDLTFNQVEAVFTRRFDVPESKAVAFRGRLQHLQRLNFPTDVNTGRGKKASYGWLQIVQLMVALDLIDLGMTPDVAVRSVWQGTDKLIGAICEVIAQFESADSLTEAMKNARCPFGMTRIALASAFALTFPQADDGPALILILDGPAFTEQLTKDPAVEPAAAFINLGSRMMLVAQFVGTAAAVELGVIAADLIEWSSHWLGQDSQS